MAVTTIQRLQARRDARFHVQLEIDAVGDPPRDAGPVTIRGHVIRVFRGEGRLPSGSPLEVGVLACRGDVHVPPGLAYLSYDALVQARYIEAFLDGEPPHCSVALDECQLVDAPSEVPVMTVAELELIPSANRPRRWWQIWRGPSNTQ